MSLSENINTDWNTPDENGIVNVPDEFDELFNKVSFQINFHTLSGKGEVQTIVDIVRIAQNFFAEFYAAHPELLIHKP